MRETAQHGKAYAEKTNERLAATKPDGKERTIDEEGPFKNKRELTKSLRRGGSRGMDRWGRARRGRDRRAKLFRMALLENCTGSIRGNRWRRDRWGRSLEKKRMAVVRTVIALRTRKSPGGARRDSLEEEKDK